MPWCTQCIRSSGSAPLKLRPGQGMFVNGKRVFLKGVDRHSFWPDSGRTLSELISRDDINVIKETERQRRP
jgi:beta-galactosidase/beta-glucuronidase